MVHDMNHMKNEIHETESAYLHEGHDMMMMMYFYFGYENVQMIIKNWIIDNIPDMVGSCTGLFLIAIIFEFFKVFRDVKTQELNKQFEKKEPRFEDSQSGLEDNHHERENHGSEQPLLNQNKSPFAVFGNKIHILLRNEIKNQNFLITLFLKYGRL
jgi:copper transporter 1